jgi:DNA repair exonuclease SbcCD ATPase subunit
MNITFVRAQNLFSISSVELALKDRGLVLIDGMSEDDGCSNGAGKSTVANKIILWTLFGRTAGGLKADKVVNRRTDSKLTTWGEVCFEGADGRNYRAYRQRNPTDLKLWLEHEKEELTARHGKDTQELIDLALGRDFDTFLHTDFFGQGRKDSFLELTPKQQGDLLEEILPIDKVSEWLVKAKALRERNAEQLDGIAYNIKRDKTLIYEKKSYISALIAQEEVWITKLQNKIERLEKEIGHCVDITPYISQRDTLYEKLKGCERPDQEEIKRETKKWQEGKTYWTVTLNNFDIQPIRGTCKTCKQVLPENERMQLIAKHKEMLEAAETYKSNLKASTEWSTYWERQQELLDQFSSLDKVQEHITKSPCNALKQQLEDVKIEKSPYIELIIKTKADLDYMNDTLAFDEKCRDNLTLELDRIDYWVKVFSKDFKSLLLQKACPYLEARTREHLLGLGNPQLKVIFSTAKFLQSGDARDEFNIQVSSDTGGEGFDSLSGGEQQIVSFAVGLALADLAAAQVGGPSKFMILDEPFMSLSDKNCENVVAYLQSTISNVKSTILLITNEQSLKMLIPERILVVKSGGITSIEN